MHTSDEAEWGRYKTAAVQRYQQRKLGAAMITGAETQKVGHSATPLGNMLAHIYTYVLILVHINSTQTNKLFYI
jgi:hypothetical protein